MLETYPLNLVRWMVGIQECHFGGRVVVEKPDYTMEKVRTNNSTKM